jgi:hypothetical protein
VLLTQQPRLKSNSALTHSSTKRLNCGLIQLVYGI